jgi:hypothetical protein
MHQFLSRVHSMFEGTFTQCTHKYLMRMLSARISSWCVCSVHGARISSWCRWCVGSVHASVPYAYAEHVWRDLCSVDTQVPDASAQCTHEFLMRMPSARISSCQCTHRDLMQHCICCSGREVCDCCTWGSLGDTRLSGRHVFLLFLQVHKHEIYCPISWRQSSLPGK